VDAFIATFGGLDIVFGSSGAQKEATDRRLHGDSVGGASERLAIGAVANPHRARVDLGFKGNLAAVATAVNFHRRLQIAAVGDSTWIVIFLQGEDRARYHLQGLLDRWSLLLVKSKSGAVWP